METEFKYILSNPEIFDRIVDNDEFRRIGMYDPETIEMHAAYFDTPDMDLMKKGIAYRIRHEDDRVTATIKWDVNVNEGLHRREEFNLVVNDERFAENPDISIFLSSDAYEVLYEAAGDKKLQRTIAMDYTRRQFKIDTGKSISCISADEGTIYHISGSTLPISELEIEWYYGDENDFIELANRIQSEYKLGAEDRSKLQRAYE